MGIYNRDYFRNDQRRIGPISLSGGYKWLIAANVVVYIFQLLAPGVTGLLELDPESVLGGQVWRLVTYGFCHDPHSPLHILFNMLFVLWFGATLERMYGTREFVLFYLAAVVISGVAFLGLALALDERAPAIGASGAVMAVVMLYAVHFPRDEMYVLLFRVQIRYLVLFYVVYDSWPILAAFGGQGRSDGIAHGAHLGGLAFGYLYHRLGLRLDRSFEKLKRLPAMRLRRPRQPESIRLYDPPRDAPRPPERRENLEVEVDAILAKIQAQGEASLSDHERDILRMASQRYKENLRNR